MPKKTNEDLTLLQLGFPTEVDDNFDVSPLIKYRGSVRLSSDGKTTEQYHVGIVLRLNGRVEIYHNFTLISAFYKAN